MPAGSVCLPLENVRRRSSSCLHRRRPWSGPLAVRPDDARSWTVDTVVWSGRPLLWIAGRPAGAEVERDLGRGSGPGARLGSVGDECAGASGLDSALGHRQAPLGALSALAHGGHGARARLHSIRADGVVVAWAKGRVYEEIAALALWRRDEPMRFGKASREALRNQPRTGQWNRAGRVAPRARRASYRFGGARKNGECAGV